ncbi:MAG: DUF615 domain-containing protein [Proteobacteria bacterium]|nr:DUF615 domain-containing protein [Pseudomonadota bacterium]
MADQELPDDAVAAPDRPSKSRLKRESHALQDLGLAAAELPEAHLADLAIPDVLRDAILAYKRTRSHEGRRRALQYVGKLMRNNDPAPIRDAVDALRLGRAQDALALHEAERWRAELIASDDALTRWVAEHPDGDLQRLRGLVRQARKDAAPEPEQRSGRAYRELFQWIKEELADG